MLFQWTDDEKIHKGGRGRGRRRTGLWDNDGDEEYMEQTDSELIFDSIS